MSERTIEEIPSERGAEAARRAAASPVLGVVRPLVRTYQAFVEMAGRHIRSLGLTPAQFDVVATLGNTAGMSPTELSRRTLIAKASLSGILQRLQAQGLVELRPHEGDLRRKVAVLTPRGQALFERVFPEHIRYVEARLATLTQAEREALQTALGALQRALADTEPGRRPSREPRTPTAREARPRESESQDSEAERRLSDD